MMMKMDSNLIKLCAAACEQVYDDLTPATDVQDLRYSIREVEEFGVVIVAIRGTDNIKNVIRDASVWPGHSPRGFYAHGGFVHAYNRLVDAGLIAVLNRYRKNYIIATGHSMGGAIATLLAEFTSCKLVTFGSPRVYWRFGSAPNLDHIRIVCDDDPVPGMPRLLYRHYSDPVVWKDADCQLIDVKDHYMANYLARVEVCSA